MVLNSYGDSKATPFDLAPDKSINICLKLYAESIDRFAKKKLESVEICWECENNIGEQYIVTGIINGDIVYDGPRYDEVLTPTFHAIKVYWKTQKEVID